MTNQVKEFPLSAEVELIKELSLAFGPSGYEKPVADLIESKIKDICDGYTRDTMGNLIAVLHCGDGSERKRVMLSAHMDEVGVMVTAIEKDGLLRFDTVGGINVSVLEGRAMTLGDERGTFPALVASKAIHHVDRADRDKAKEITKLYIDIGATSKEDAEELVSVGSVGTFSSPFYLFGENGEFMKGKALDDRVGCAVLIQTLKELYADRPSLDLDLYFCFTVREEIGLSGAKTAANKIRPDLAVVLESTAVADLPDVDVSRRVADLGGGGAISLADRATLYNREFISFALNVGKKNSIPVQTKRYVSGGNDAGSIHKSGSGVKVLALSLPTRYLHSPACVAKVSDATAVRDLLVAMLRDGELQGI